jgi:REP element-mobilizing transposase RayT
MTYARKSLISLQDTPYYHVVARCVRRAWLWGFDEYAGRDYSHRKAWVLERLTQLSSMFAIDICAYAIMSNHYHLVVYVDQARARGWTMHEVIERWTQLFARPPLIERWEQGMCDDAEREIAERIVDLWRRRLCDVSWYMRCLNEHLARRANAEDRCTGRFWEGRFKSQALLDESGLLTAMVYVDLNPIRAGIAATPEESEFTSIYERIREFREAKPTTSDLQSSESLTRAGPPLLAFASAAQPAEPTIPFTLQDYMALVDWTGRARRADKRGAIDPHAPAIMQRLNLDADAWRMAMQSRSNVFGRALGQLDHMRLHARTLGQSWVQGLRRAEQLYRT